MIYFIKKHIVMIVIGVVIVIGLFFIRHHETSQLEEETFAPFELQEEEEVLEIEESETSLVDIKGEVVSPGVYELESNARVNDVIYLAGGFTDEANQAFINLAQKVQDEMVIIVPKEGDEEGLAQQLPLNDSSHTDEQKVSINQATKEEIETLPGIGPSKAQAIIDYREENGAFGQTEDLLQVNGIGEKTLDNLLDHIAIP